MYQRPKGEKLKPWRVYATNPEWKTLKVHCAKEGISISQWVREQIHKLPIIVICILAVATMIFFLYPTKESENAELVSEF